MSTAGPPPSEPDALASQVEALQRETQALAAAQASARLARLAMLAALAVFVVVVCLAFYRLGNRVASKETLDAVTKEAQERLAKDPELYMRQVRLLVDDTSPVIKDALYAQAKKDMPAFVRSAEEQRDLLAKDLQDQLMKKFDQRYEKILARHGERLQKEFPEAKDPAVQERMLNNLRRAADGLARKYYADELQRQMETLYAGWDGLPAAEKPGKNDPRLEDQLIAALQELMTRKLAYTDAAAATARP
jgi:hypothetical protein